MESGFTFAPHRLRKAVSLRVTWSVAAATAVVVSVAVGLARYHTGPFAAADAEANAVSRLVARLDGDGGGVGIVQLFKGMPAGAVPPFPDAAWDGKVLDGNFMILAYPVNVLNQASPIARMRAYYIDPRDHALIRMDADFSKLPGGGIVLEGDLMTGLHVALHRGAGTSYTTERVCYAYPGAMPLPALRPDAGMLRVSPRVVANAGEARSFFYAYGAGVLCIRGAVAPGPGPDSAQTAINHTLNIQN